MAFILDDRDQSITSESAPFLQPVDYDSDIELFQVPLKRESSPIRIPNQDPVSQPALQYALTTSSPPDPSEDSLSTNSQTKLTSRDTSPHNKTASSPPSSVDSKDHEALQDQKHKHSNASNQKNKILQATQLHLTKSKAKTVLTKRPKKLILPLKANIYQRIENDGDDEGDFDRIHQWLEACHVNRTTTCSASKNQATTGTGNEETSTTGRAIIAGPHLLHPFLGPALFSPPMAEPKVYAINIHGTLAHHTLNPDSENHNPTRTSSNPRPRIQKNRYKADGIHVDKGWVHVETEGFEILSDRNSSHQATSDSAYDRAREMEISLSEHKSIVQPNVLLRGKAHWFIDANLTEESHFRLAEVARTSASGFETLRRHHFDAAHSFAPSSSRSHLHSSSGGGCGCGGGGVYLSGGLHVGRSVTGTGSGHGDTGSDYTWGPGGTFTTQEGADWQGAKKEHARMRDVEERQQRLIEAQTAAELAELYKALAVVHTVFGEGMRAERERIGDAGGGESNELCMIGDENKERERGRGRHRDRYGGARERDREPEHRGETGVVRRRSMGSKIGSLRGRRRRRVVS